MAILISHLTLTLDEPETEFQPKIARAIGISSEKIQDIRIIKKSLDARHKNRLRFIYSLEFSLPEDEEKRVLAQPSSSLKVQEVRAPASIPPQRIKNKPRHRPVIVGTGPAALFAALRLCASGWPPLLLERGKEMPERVKDVEKFWRNGILDPESNIQFGEGGAGTFSDGKLFTRLNDPRVAFILNIFSRFGAPAEIIYFQKPHIGTDKLRRIIMAMRQYLKEQGAEFHFQAKVTGVQVCQRHLAAVVVNHQEEIEAPLLLLGPGNSARDTYRMLGEAGVAMESKPFAIGLRVEHPQGLIDRIQYGSSAGHPRLPPAEYQLTYGTSQGRSVYSFCMCPGGAVIAASSERGGLATNGMSFFARNSRWANSALVVQVGPEDFGTPGPFAGVEFQRRWEEKAFRLGGENYYAPAQGLSEFLEGRAPSLLGKTSFRPGITPARLEECLPAFAVEGLREAFPYFNRKMRGFAAPEAVLLGIESRTSAPLRILRGEDGQSVNVRGLYPIGEGSGYAGGIVSSALDGLKAAEVILKQIE